MATKQYGGEMKGSYSGHKTMKAEGVQHGGEGKSMGMKGGAANPNQYMTGKQYCGPGRNLAPGY